MESSGAGEGLEMESYENSNEPSGSIKCWEFSEAEQLFVG
jgi:hypothetical protein